ncbi:hypothetical protein SAMN05444158_2607 [Bradyrhizobium canariense]|uniref:Uncharacterized protein n=1 Tax=Bradyrhizobium canariense TaxID=255045 RepID=A0A1H1TM89_9BRAD|nr:hypothetical protein SAMN05444158_2607 [Bradyrhizobium canariense]
MDNPRGLPIATIGHGVGLISLKYTNRNAGGWRFFVRLRQKTFRYSPDLKRKRLVSAGPMTSKIIINK